MEKKSFCPAFKAARYALFCAALVGVALFCMTHSGCQISTEGISVLGAKETPEVDGGGAKVVDAKSVQLNFSVPVTVNEADVSELSEGQDASIFRERSGEKAEHELSEDGKKVTFKFPQTKIGARYQLYFEVADERGNSLTGALPFVGFNDRVPILILEEVSGKSGSLKLNGESASCCEYIVIRALTGGNLAGIELFSPRYKELSAYNFPALEVKAGERIMLHLRSYEGQSYENELDEDLAKDCGPGSKNHIRDLYYENGKKCVGDKYDIIFLRNRVNMEILDAVLYTTKAEKEKFLNLSDAAKLLVESEKWMAKNPDFDPYEDFESGMSATTRCLRRANSDELFERAISGGLAQKDIRACKEDWKTDATLYKRADGAQESPASASSASQAGSAQTAAAIVNENLPILILEEISGAPSNKEFKSEYIVIRALTGGNLAGIELFSPRYKELSAYNFPALEVKAGERIMLRTKTFEGQSYENELDEDLAKDCGPGSKNHIRDLYYESGKKCVSEKYDIIFLRTKGNMKILDAIFYSYEKNEGGKTFEKCFETAKEAVKSEKWTANNPDLDPFVIEGNGMTATTKCLRRANSDELFERAKSGGLAQKDIRACKEDWKTDATLYNASRD